MQNSSLPLRILGIDPGLRHCGVGIIESHQGRARFLMSQTIHPKPKLSMPERLLELQQQLSQIIASYQPDCCAIEETFVSINGQSTLKLGQARGAILLTLALARLPVNEYAARLVKKSITGSGSADKTQISHMVKLLLPHSEAKSEDEADALAIALTHMHHAASLSAAS